MSLSHQKNQLDKKMNKQKLECPSCGFLTMNLKTGTSKLSDGLKVTHIKKWVCEKCGEELFDLKTMKEIRKQRKEKSVIA